MKTYSYGSVKEKPRNIEPKSKELYNFPIVFLTGHGNVYFSDQASKNLRNYLISGGFLHISDNYGLDDFIRKEMKKGLSGTGVQGNPL